MILVFITEFVLAGEFSSNINNNNNDDEDDDDDADDDDDDEDDNYNFYRTYPVLTCAFKVRCLNGVSFSFSFTIPATISLTFSIFDIFLSACYATYSWLGGTCFSCACRWLCYLPQATSNFSLVTLCCLGLWLARLTIFLLIGAGCCFIFTRLMYFLA